MSNREELREKTVTCQWVIKNWAKVVQNEELVVNTKLEIRFKVEDVLGAKFLVGITVSPSNAGQTRYIRFYWKLLNKHFCLDTVHTNVIFETLNREGQRNHTFKREAKADIGKIEITDRDFFKFGYSDDVSHYTNLKGSLITKVYVTLKNLPRIICCSKKEEFKNTSSDELVKNMATLLGDNGFADIKILTRDKGELFAHKAILTARCPMFSSMFRSEFLESTTGIIKVDDISTKTMKTLLHYWYTGELLPCWRDHDTVVEFTHAAEKYQMNQVLNMLDNMLGCGFSASEKDVELLKLVKELSLKNAAARLLKRIVHNVSNCSSGAELLFVLSFPNVKLYEQNLTCSEMLKSFDNFLSEQDHNDACVNDMILLALSCKLGLKNVENKFLKRIIGTVDKYNSPAQVFALIGLQNETYEDELSGKDLLVRAKSS